jgi:acetoacetate decarboxylase
MPLVNPSYPPGPYRFVDRGYMIIVYRRGLRGLGPRRLGLEG